MRYALISVTDKQGLANFAQRLDKIGFQIISTGGTAKELGKAGIPYIDASAFTGQDEILDGRVKTLHPKIHAGILSDMQRSEHAETLSKLSWPKIDLVAVNLYQFEQAVSSKKLSLNDSMDYVDIGGPSMLRGAAKNYRSTLVVIDPNDYDRVATALEQEKVDDDLRVELAGKVFMATAAYDAAIAAQFQANHQGLSQKKLSVWHKRQELRYGENPQQDAALYALNSPPRGLAAAVPIQGKELSYNNILDMDAALQLVSEFAEPACVIVKHTNPCGVAVARADLFESAFNADPKCAFGGIVAFNRPVEESDALLMRDIFLECIIAPDFDAKALEIFSAKKNLRLVRVDASPSREIVRSINGGFLVQSADISPDAEWRVVSRREPDKNEWSDARFAMTVCKHVKSNAIVYVKDGVTLGIGAGQMSRIDSAKFGAQKAQELGHSLQDAVVASDAFFPFRDSVDYFATLGVRTIVQPGGSVRDHESIDATNQNGMSMILTGMRHFKH